MDRNLNGCLRAFFLFLIGSLAVSCNRSENQAPTPTPTPEATLTPAATATPTPTPEATLSPAATATPTPTPEATLSPAATATPTPTPEATLSPAATASPTPTPEAATLSPSPNVSNFSEFPVEKRIRKVLPAPQATAETTTTAEPTLTPTPAATPSAGQATPPAAPAAATMPLEAGMSRADRLRVQETLRRLGYYQGQADGIFGPLTRAAIRRFQSEIGATSTGRLTAEEASRLVNTH